MDITTVTSSGPGLLSNTHLVDAPDGIIVVDPPMLLSDARSVRARVDQRARPLAAFVYTHPYPDHVNGATEIRGSSDVPVRGVKNLRWTNYSSVTDKTAEQRDQMLGDTEKAFASLGHAARRGPKPVRRLSAARMRVPGQ